MKKLVNIRLKDEPNARLTAIKKYKDEFHFGLAECKDAVDKLLCDGELVLDGSTWGLLNHGPDITKYLLSKIFDFEIEGKDDYDHDQGPRGSYGVVAIEPDEATKEALAWYENQPDEVKAKIDLITIWRTPICVAQG